MSEHHELSPSHYNAWAHCPNWDSDEKQTTEATAGTNHHKEMEMGLNDPTYEPNTSVARWAVETIRNLAGDGVTVMPEYKLKATLPTVKGIYGTTDAFWIDNDGAWHFADLKSFSDGSEDYTPQLKGYAYLYATKSTGDVKVYLHILHGGIFKCQTVETDILSCCLDTNTILANHKNRENYPLEINHYCQYCKHKKECQAMNNAIATVASDNSVAFSELPLAKKLVICDAIEKIVKAIKDEAKQKAIENGGFIEDEGVRYEIKERAGRGKVRDLTEVASALSSTPDGMKSITTDDLLKICDLPKTAFVNAMKAANDGNKSIKKKDIENWCADFYEKGEPTQYLARVE